MNIMINERKVKFFTFFKMQWFMLIRHEAATKCIMLNIKNTCIRIKPTRKSNTIFKTTNIISHIKKSLSQNLKIVLSVLVILIIL